MQAASAIPGVHALAGDPLAAPDGVAVDGFSQALAAMMALLGPGLAAATPTQGTDAGGASTAGAALGPAVFIVKPTDPALGGKLAQPPTTPACAGGKQGSPIALPQGGDALALAAKPTPQAAETVAGATPAPQDPPTGAPGASEPSGNRFAPVPSVGVAPGQVAATPNLLDPALARFVSSVGGPPSPTLHQGGLASAPGLATASGAPQSPTTAPTPDAQNLPIPDPETGSPSPPASVPIAIAPFTPLAASDQMTPAGDRWRTPKAEARAAATASGAPRVQAGVETVDAYAAVTEASRGEAGSGAAPDSFAKPQNQGDGGAPQSPGAQTTDPSASLAGAGAPPAAPAPFPPAAAALAAANGAQITTQLAAQIGRRSEMRQGRFDFALEPQGLGRVDVSLKIDAAGQLSALLAFDNPATAAEAKNRAGDLQTALQQAGFDLSQGSLSFTSGGSAGGQGQAAWQDAWSSPARASASFTDPAPSAPTAATPPPSRPGGLDIRI